MIRLHRWAAMSVHLYFHCQWLDLFRSLAGEASVSIMFWHTHTHTHVHTHTHTHTYTHVHTHTHTHTHSCKYCDCWDLQKKIRLQEVQSVFQQMSVCGRRKVEEEHSVVFASFLKHVNAGEICLKLWWRPCASSAQSSAWNLFIQPYVSQRAKGRICLFHGCCVQTWDKLRLSPRLSSSVHFTSLTLLQPSKTKRGSEDALRDKLNKVKLSEELVSELVSLSQVWWRSAGFGQQWVAFKVRLSDLRTPLPTQSGHSTEMMLLHEIIKKSNFRFDLWVVWQAEESWRRRTFKFSFLQKSVTFV